MQKFHLSFTINFKVICQHSLYSDTMDIGRLGRIVHVRRTAQVAWADVLIQSVYEIGRLWTSTSHLVVVFRTS